MSEMSKTRAVAQHHDDGSDLNVCHLLEQNKKSNLISDLVVAVVTAVGLPIEF